MAKQQTRKAYSYLRFSTPEQSKGDSRRRQTRLAVEYAARHGLVLDDKLTFHDLGVSAFRGANIQRGQLGDFLNAADSGLVESGSYLLVENLDRISRSSALEALDYLRRICKLGITVVTLSDGQEYTHERLIADPTAAIISLVLFARAHEESAIKAKRVRAAWDGKRERIASGEKMTGKVPGWLIAETDAKGRLVIRVNKERAAVVRRVYTMALKGIGKQAIAETLNRAGVPVFGRSKHWRQSYIVKLLGFSAVTGVYEPHMTEVDASGRTRRRPLDPIPGYYPRVVKQEVFDQVQRLQGTAPLRGRHSSRELQNLFGGGLLRCPLCNGPMVRVYKGSGPKGGAPSVVCGSAKAGAGCDYRSVKYPPLEAAFLESAPALLNEPPAGDSEEAKRVDRELEQAEAALLSIPTQMENLVRSIERGTAKGKAAEALERRLLELEAAREPLYQLTAELRSRRDDLSGRMVEKVCEDLLTTLAAKGGLDRGQANAYIRQLFAGITVDYESGRLLFAWRHGGESEVIYAWPEGKRRAKPWRSRKK